MAELFDTKTKERVDVPDTDAPDAVLSGRYGLAGGSKLMLYRPDGQAVTIPAESAPEAFQKGYKYAPQTEVHAQENAEKYGEFGSKLLAAGAGAARGLTLGLSDRALRNLGVEAKTLRNLEEGAPFTSGIGEVAGSIAGVALTGGAGGAGQAAARATGATAGKGLLARAGAKAIELGVAGGIEGAAFGAGQAVTEDALGRADLTAESLIANAGLGAAVGLGAGALIGGGGTIAMAGARKAAGKVGEKLGAGGVKEWLEDFAGERALKATLGQQKRAFTQLEDKGLTDKAKKYLLEEIGIDKLDSTESIAEKLAAKRASVDATRADWLRKLDEAAPESAAKKLSGELIADRIESEIVANIDPVAQKSTRDAMQQVADGYRGQGPLTFAEAAKKRAAAQANSNFDAAVPRPTQQAWRDVSRLWNDTIDEAAEPILKSLGDKTGAAYKAAREEFSLVHKLTEYAENRVQGNAANRFVSPTDYGIGGAAGMMTGDPVSGAIAAFGHKTVRERGSAFAANVAYKMSRLGAIQKAAQAVDGRVESAVVSFLDRASRGAATHTAPAVTQTLLNTSFMPKAAAAKNHDRRDAAKERAKEIAQLVADPQRMADRIATSLAGIDEAAPTVSGHAAVTATKAVQHLHAKAPKNPRSANTLQPMLDDWKPSDQEVAKFERHVRAAMDPLSVLEDLGAGTLTQEAADTFRELYPQLHLMTFSKLTERLAEAKKKLPYVDRVNLSILFGAPVDDSMRPEFITRTQAIWEKKPTEGGGRVAPSTGNLDLASNMRSPTQKLEVKQ